MSRKSNRNRSNNDGGQNQDWSNSGRQRMSGGQQNSQHRDGRRGREIEEWENEGGNQSSRRSGAQGNAFQINDSHNPSNRWRDQENESGYEDHSGNFQDDSRSFGGSYGGGYSRDEKGSQRGRDQSSQWQGNQGWQGGEDASHESGRWDNDQRGGHPQGNYDSNRGNGAQGRYQGNSGQESYGQGQYGQHYDQGSNRQGQGGYSQGQGGHGHGDYGSSNQSSFKPGSQSQYGGAGNSLSNHSGKGPRGYKRQDERITEDVNERLTQDPHIDAEDIEVSVSSGEVTLEGTVEDRRSKRMVEDLVEQISGVKNVINHLRLKSSSESSSDSSRTTAGSTGSSSTGLTRGSSDAASSRGSAESSRSTTKTGTT